MSLIGSEEMSTSFEVEEAWVFLELYQADCIFRDPWKSAVLGVSTFFQKGYAGHARLLSEA